MCGDRKGYDMKRFFAIALVFALIVVVFAACGKDEKKDDGGQSSEPPESNSDSGSESESYEAEYYATDVNPVSPDGEGVDLPEVPLLPNGQIPAGE